MEPQALRPENLDERLVWYALTGTWAFYLTGALYVVAPALAWLLLARVAWRLLRQGPHTPPQRRVRVPWPVLGWIAGMGVMLLALVVGHLHQGLGLVVLVKSVIGWAKGWALLALFPLIGCLPIRPQLVHRAACVVCLHTLLAMPVFVFAWAAGAPQTAWVSPLQVVGGPGPEFFAVSLYEIEPGSGTPRWRLFTPWAPALGLVANVYLLCALEERSRRWRAVGVLGSVAMVLVSRSRLALVALLSVWLCAWLLSRLAHARTLLAAGPAFAVAGLAGAWLIECADNLWQTFRAARAGSTRVREILARIALDRWQNEAPVWGHGTVERGPQLVEFMPIGSHHTWLGLLFVKGAAGLAALLLPMLWSLADLLRRAQHDRNARTALALLLLLALYTFGENLEMLAYLFWPALLLIGHGHGTRVATRPGPVTLPPFNDTTTHGTAIP